MAEGRILGAPSGAAATEAASLADRVAVARLWRGVGLGQVLLLMTIVVMLAAGRSFLSFGTETDFLLAFMREAARLIRGDALAVGFHPPLYPALLAANHALTGDWLASGLLISTLAALATSLACWRLFESVLGPAAAAGALLMLLASPVFLQFAAQATTDLLYLALFMVAGWLGVAGSSVRNRGAGVPSAWCWAAPC
jgi:hypothetical protein